MTTEPQALQPTTKTALREELARVRDQLNEYVGYEPTIREEMQHLSSENETLRKAVAFLMIEATSKTTVDIWNDDLDYRAGRLDFEPSPNRKDSTLFTFTPGAGRMRNTHKKPINHRAEAERHASQAAHLKSDRQHHPIDPIAADFHLRMALVHATLARGEDATATDTRDANTLLRRRDSAVRDLVAQHIAHALTSSDTTRWRAARDLAQALDGADANLDNLIDERLTDDGNDPKTAWNAPTARQDDDPWAPDPKLQKLADARRVISAHLAEAFLDCKSLEVRTWARGLVQELNQVGIDLGDEITAHLRRHTLNDALSDEPPF